MITSNSIASLLPHAQRVTMRVPGARRFKPLPGGCAPRFRQAGEAIAAIAATHERKIGAITARLARLGLITEDGVVQPG